MILNENELNPIVNLLFSEQQQGQLEKDGKS